MKKKFASFELFGVVLSVGFHASTIRHITSRNGRFYIPLGILYQRLPTVQDDVIEGEPVCHCLNFVFLFFSIDFGLIK